MKDNNTIKCIYCGTKNKYKYSELSEEEIVETTIGHYITKYLICKKCHKKIHIMNN